ncbi:MAG: pre-peptidase C-terminal domain-containing protein, partial [Candidatus Pacearchaeota archaeon]
MRQKILFFTIVILLLSCYSYAALPHHVYIGVFAGKDNNNPSSGGWDNDYAYSVDREMVNWQNRNFAFEQTFMSADCNVANLELITYQELELIWYYGRVPMVNLSFDSLIGCQRNLVEIDNDLSDPSSLIYQGLVKWSQGLKKWFDLGKPAGKNNRFLLLAFLQEPNFSFCAIESDKSTWDFVNPDAFKSAFRKGRAIVESVIGHDYISNVHWVFAPTIESNNFMPGFEAYYPGDDVVDWMGLSAYNFGGYVKQGFTHPWQYFKDLVVPYLDRLRRLAPRKPIALLQTGSISYGGDKNLWLIDFLSKAVNYPKLYIIIYYNTIVQGEAGYPPGFDWPIYWNDPYDSTPYGYNVYLPQMRYNGWLDAINNNHLLVFSPIPMPLYGAFKSANWDIPGQIAPISNEYDIFPELRDKDADFDGDGLSNYQELESGLDPLIRDVQLTETDCHDGVDNDGNGRIDADDTVYCGDIPLSEASLKIDYAKGDEKRYFKFMVPAGSSKVIIEIKSISGDVDLYVRQTDRPTFSSFDYKSSQTSQTNEKVEITNPTPGIWHVLVYGVSESNYDIIVNNSFIVLPKIADIRNAITCDIDGNGQDDMIFSIYNYGVQVYLNNSTWLNLLADGTNPSLMLCNDINGDGIQEVIGTWNSVMKYFDIAVWSWRDIQLPGDVPIAMTIGDLDLDGRDDIIATFRNLNSLMYRSSTTGIWNNIDLGTLPVPDEIFAVNMDTDPELEIVCVFRGLKQIKIYDSGTWNNVNLPHPYMPDIVGVGYIDNDGIGDIVGVWRTNQPYS